MSSCHLPAQARMPPTSQHQLTAYSNRHLIQPNQLSLTPSPPRKITHNSSTVMSRSQVIRAPSTSTPHPQSVLLAGSTSPLGLSWRTTLLSILSSTAMTVYEPTRADWDDTWREDVDFAPFAEQVDWELARLTRADVAAVCLDPETKAPVSLLELGLVAGGPGTGGGAVSGGILEEGGCEGCVCAVWDCGGGERGGDGGGGFEEAYWVGVMALMVLEWDGYVYILSVDGLLFSRNGIKVDMPTDFFCVVQQSLVFFLERQGYVKKKTIFFFRFSLFSLSYFLFSFYFI